MSQEPDVGCGGALFLGGVGLVLGFVLGSDVEDVNIDKMKHEAIEHGYAEWVVDQKTGKTTWRWKALDVEKKP